MRDNQKGPIRRYGSESRWNTLGSHKMLFIVGLAMCPMFIGANVLPSSSLTRVRVQDVDCTKLEPVRSSAVLQHCTDWDQPMDNETRNQEQQYEFRSSLAAVTDETLHEAGEDHG